MNEWFEYETVTGAKRWVRIADIAAVREHSWTVPPRASPTGQGFKVPYTHLIAADGSTLARVPHPAVELIRGICAMRGEGE